jgi:hypothetical protein
VVEIKDGNCFGIRDYEFGIQTFYLLPLRSLNKFNKMESGAIYEFKHILSYYIFVKAI